MSSSVPPPGAHAVGWRRRRRNPLPTSLKVVATIVAIALVGFGVWAFVQGFFGRPAVTPTSTSTTSTTTTTTTTTTAPAVAPEPTTTTTSVVPATGTLDVSNIAGGIKGWDQVVMTDAFKAFVDANKSVVGFTAADMTAWSGWRHPEGNLIDARALLALKSSNLTDEQLLAAAGLPDDIMVYRLNEGGVATVGGSTAMIRGDNSLVVLSPLRKSSGGVRTINIDSGLLLSLDGNSLTVVTWS